MVICFCCTTPFVTFRELANHLETTFNLGNRDDWQKAMDDEFIANNDCELYQVFGQANLAAEARHRRTHNQIYIVYIAIQEYNRQHNNNNT